MYKLGIKSVLFSKLESCSKLLKSNPQTILKNILFHACIFKFHSYPLFHHTIIPK